MLAPKLTLLPLCHPETKAGGSQTLASEPCPACLHLNITLTLPSMLILKKMILPTNTWLLGVAKDRVNGYSKNPFVA